MRQIDYFQEAEDLVNDWLTEWGGLECWNRYLDKGFLEAKATGDVDRWTSAIMDHADRGRRLAGIIGQMETNIPTEMWKIRELWRQQTVLASHIFRGLALIEVRVDVVRTGGPFNLLSN
ncbi:hypothetical protein BDN72DRAFT_780003 [Pluteus cervinus]|uniref:Uncharacterized protein n=1 Tax=Pluteus cervinus TaxID=181527 RepID=A0ACD3A2S7_9AGAR|nr:hypothetical protein BDN72DRAFT_780003 [Pluteus cervinus]